MKKTNNKGFTIVELVIVIAVIAILAAVMIPTFAGVVENANESAALQNARHAYTEYLVDHPEAEIDYVKYVNEANEAIFYDVNDEFAIFSGTPANDADVLEVGTCLDGNDENGDGRCDTCGRTIEN